MSTTETDLAISKDLIHKNLETREPYLDLGKSGLTNLDLVPGLFNCDHLETLVLSDSWDEYIDGEWKHKESQNGGSPNRIEGLTSSIAKLKNLKILVCGSPGIDPWPISDLSPIAKLKQLQTLNLPNNSIADVGSIRGMNSLQVVILDQNHITDLSPLSKLIKMQTLALNQNRIKDISALRSLKNLKKLYIRENQIVDISPLSKLVHLQILELDKNKITDLSPLSNILEVRNLHFDSNEISELSPLAELVHMEVLRGAKNRIEDLLPLSKLDNLEIIDLSDNRISYLSPISSMKKLKELHIKVNQIDDIEQLRHLPVSLERLTIDRNPFIRKADLILDIDVYLPTKVLLLGNHQCGKRRIQARHLDKNGTLSWHSSDIAVHPFEPFAGKSFTKIKKVFISYSHDDIEFRNAVHQYLINLQREGTVEIWHDELINTGEDWNEQILSALQEADLVILLVSQSFIASTYVNEVEMKTALSNMGSGKTIFPVLIKNCDWRKWRIYPDNVDPQQIGGGNMGTAMGSFQFFPFDEQNHPKPINRWEYPEDAWTQLADKIRALS